MQGLRVDMRNFDDITNAFKIIEDKYGPVHVLVNNAGGIEFSTLSDGEVEDWKKTFDLNVLGKSMEIKSFIIVDQFFSFYHIRQNETLPCNCSSFRSLRRHQRCSKKHEEK